MNNKNKINDKKDEIDLESDIELSDEKIQQYRESFHYFKTGAFNEDAEDSITKIISCLVDIKKYE